MRGRTISSISEAIVSQRVVDSLAHPAKRLGGQSVSVFNPDTASGPCITSQRHRWRRLPLCAKPPVYSVTGAMGEWR